MSGTQVAASTPTRRERARAATVAEIKQVALDLMREHGTTDVRFTDIARVMGLPPPPCTATTPTATRCSPT